MLLGKVLGTVVSSVKVDSLKGIKLLIVQILDEKQKPIDSPVIAVDGTEQAGIGDTVFIVSGREAALALQNWFNPADYAIVGIVDQVSSNTPSEEEIKLTLSKLMR